MGLTLGDGVQLGVGCGPNSRGQGPTGGWAQASLKGTGSNWRLGVGLTLGDGVKLGVGRGPNSRGWGQTRFFRSCTLYQLKAQAQVHCTGTLVQVNKRDCTCKLSQCAPTCDLGQVSLHTTS